MYSTLNAATPVPVHCVCIVIVKCQVFCFLQTSELHAVCADTHTHSGSCWVNESVEWCLPVKENEKKMNIKLIKIQIYIVKQWIQLAQCAFANSNTKTTHTTHTLMTHDGTKRMDWKYIIIWIFNRKKLQKTKRIQYWALFELFSASLPLSSDFLCEYFWEEGESKVVKRILPRR